jgi:glycosyltransferase involved in cell wall biosynthesis
VKVAFFGYEDVELIIVDGTVMPMTINDQILLHNHTVIQEEDSGIFNAMNKGVKSATGTYVLFLNSGDVISQSRQVYNFLKILKSNEADWISFPAFTEETGNNIKSWKSPTKLRYLLGLNSYCHQAQIVKRTLIKNQSYFDEDSLVADWKFFLLLSNYAQPITLKNLEMTCEKFNYSQGYSLYRWALDIVRARQEEARIILNSKVLDFVIQMAVASILIIRKILIRKNFR